MLMMGVSLCGEEESRYTLTRGTNWPWRGSVAKQPAGPARYLYRSVFNNCGYVMLKRSLQSCTPMRECYVCFQELLTSHAKPYGTNCDRHSLTWHSTFKCIMQCSLITHYYVILNHYGKSGWLHHGKQLDKFTKRSFFDRPYLN